MTLVIFTSPGWDLNPAFLKSMEELTACFVIDAIAFSLFSIMSITHWMVYSEPLPCWFITLVSTSATVHFVILSYHMNMKKVPFPVIEEMNKTMNKINITSSNQEEEEEEDDEISQNTVQKTDTPVANTASVTAAKGEERHEKMCWVHNNIKEIVVWNFTPFLSILVMLTSPWYTSRVDITTLLMLEAFTFSQLSILSITLWVVHSEPLSCWITTLIFIFAAAQFAKLSYDMKYKKVIVTLSNDEDEDVSHETDTSSNSSAEEEEHEKIEKKWMKKCVAEELRAHESSKFIEEMNELRNKCIEDRREWEQDRNTLLEGLSAANKSVQLYRSLLHEFDQIHTSSN